VCFPRIPLIQIKGQAVFVAQFEILFTDRIFWSSDDAKLVDMMALLPTILDAV
jgi:hypothetical protein